MPKRKKSREVRPPVYTNTDSSRAGIKPTSKGTVRGNSWEIQTITQWDYLTAAILKIGKAMWQNDRGVDGSFKGKAIEYNYEA